VVEVLYMIDIQVIQSIRNGVTISFASCENLIVPPLVTATSVSVFYALLLSFKMLYIKINLQHQRKNPRKIM
jgi:hypothetical protein